MSLKTPPMAHLLIVTSVFLTNSTVLAIVLVIYLKMAVIYLILLFLIWIMKKVSRKAVKRAVKEMCDLPGQLSLFPYELDYLIDCQSTHVCYKSSCAGCPKADLVRKDFDPYTQPERY